MTDELVIGGGVLGKDVRGPRRHLDPIPLARSVGRIFYRSDEVFSHCPMTGQPDFYEAEITLYGALYGIESKSLKLYLQSFEDRKDAQFCEKFADTICEAVFDVSRAEEAQVTLKQKPRGGISIHATSSRIRTRDARDGVQDGEGGT